MGGWWKREHTAVAVGAAAAGAAIGLGGAYVVSTAARRKLANMTSFMFNVTGNALLPTTLDYLERSPAAAEAIANRLGQKNAFALLTDASTAPAGETPPQLNVGVPALGPASGASVGIVYTDERALEAAVGAGLLNRQVKLALWDYEQWPHTPAYQAADPQTYNELAAYGAHRAGLLYASAPSPNIMSIILGQASLSQSYGQAFAAMLANGQVATAARFSDVAVCQAQTFESSPTAFSTAAYSAAVRQFSLQARLSNANVAVWATLEVAPGLGTGLSEGQLYELMASVALVVDGFWFFLPVTDKDLTGDRQARANTLINLLSSL